VNEDAHHPITNDAGEIIKAGCVVVGQNQVLLVSRPDLAVGRWGFPKGHAEAGETLEQVAARETREETGYQVEIIRRLSDVTYEDSETGEQVRLALFLAKAVKEVGGGEEHAEWVDVDKARTLIYSDLLPILDEALS